MLISSSQSVIQDNESTLLNICVVNEGKDLRFALRERRRMEKIEQEMETKNQISSWLAAVNSSRLLTA